MSSTTTARPTAEALAAATLPYALTNLGQHLLDFRLPPPASIDIQRGRVTVWLYSTDLPAWCEHLDHGPTSHRVNPTFTIHWTDAVLHGSCVAVTLRWVERHPLCTSLDGCRQPVLPTDTPAGVPGCPHGDSTSALCAAHRDQCSQCRDDFRQVSAEGWDR